MKTRREYQKIELDLCYSGGKKVYSRTRSCAGYWQKVNHDIQHGTLLRTSGNHELVSLKKIVESVKRFLLKKSLGNFRVTVKKESRLVNKKLQLSQMRKSIYIETRNPHPFTYLSSLEAFTLDNLQSSLTKHFEYFSLPLLQKEIHPEILTLSPSAFGYFLHEGLGHRHESDDHESSLKFSRKKKTNFSVYDSPGKENMLGFTPFDDEGTMGRDVTLFCGKTLKTQLMTKATGNLRAVNFDFHPIIRQRCLIVKTHDPAVIPLHKTRLHVEEIHQGSWGGEHLNLQTSKTLYRDAKGTLWRLPDITLKMSPELILKMTTFGDIEISHPAGGCHKGLQRGLDVTFQTPSAWISLKGNRLSKQELDFL